MKQEAMNQEHNDNLLNNNPNDFNLTKGEGGDLKRRNVDLEADDEKAVWNYWSKLFDPNYVPITNKGASAIDFLIKPGSSHQEAIDKVLAKKWILELNEGTKDTVVILARPGDGKTTMVEEIDRQIERDSRFLFFDDVLHEFLVKIGKPMSVLYDWKKKDWKSFYNFYIPKFEATRQEAIENDEAFLAELVGVTVEDEYIMNYLSKQKRTRIAVLNADPKASEMEKVFRKWINILPPNSVVNLFKNRFGAEFKDLDQFKLDSDDYNRKSLEIGNLIKSYYSKMASLEAINYLNSRIQQKADVYAGENKDTIGKEIETAVLPYPENEDFGWRREDDESKNDQADWLTRYYYYRYLVLQKFGFNPDAVDVVMNPFNRNGVRRQFVGLNLDSISRE